MQHWSETYHILTAHLQSKIKLSYQIYNYSIQTEDNKNCQKQQNHLCMQFLILIVIQLIFIVSIILFIVICCNESIRFLKYPQHVLITFTLQSQIINHNIYINSSPHDLQWVSYRYHDKRKSPINEIPIHQASQQPLLLCNITSP